MHTDKVKLCIDLAKREMVNSIYTSANIEGLGTTYPNTEAILKNLPVTTKRDEVLFILNMRDAWQFLLGNLDYTNCLMLLREFNKISMRDLLFNSGVIRVSSVTIGGTKWVPELPIESVVCDDIVKMNKIEDAESKALVYFCYLCRAQLFYDGNKRVAQLTANKILIENGIGILRIPVEFNDKFFKLLIDYYESGDARKLMTFLKTYCIQRV